MAVPNGGRIWRFRKVDILFVVAVLVVVYGAATFRVEILLAGVGLLGIPLAQRGDKT